MATCDECGEYENLPYQCHRCGRTFCAEHRLPENHDCPGLANWDDPSGVFESDTDAARRSGGASGDSGGDGIFGGLGGRGGRGGSGGAGARGTGRGLADRVKRRVGRLTSTGGLLRTFRGNVTYLLLAVMWIVFVLEFAVIALFGQGVFRDVFMLSTAHPEYVWTWVTSIFAHHPGWLFHIVANSIGLFFFGPIVERYVGSKRFAAFFLVAGVIAGVGSTLYALAMGDAQNALGASGAVFAILGVVTVLRPNMEVLLFFVIPMKIKVLTYGLAALSLLFVLSPSLAAAAGMGGIGHLAHLLGFLVGLAYGRRVEGTGAGRGGGGRTVRVSRGPGGPGGPGRRR